MHESAKQKSKSYFDSHRKSRLARGGYWRHDYRYQLEEIGRIMPDRAVANWLFPRLPGGDVKMYKRKEIECMVRRAGFRSVRYRKISPFSFQCVAGK